MARPASLRILLAAGLLGACTRGPDASAAKARPPPLVAAARVASRDVPVEVTAPVDLRPFTQAEIGSKTAGYLDAVLVDRGDRVKKGQLLALVRPSDLPDQLAAARSQLAQSEAQAALALENLERLQKLAPSGYASQQDLQTATSQRQAAAASAEAARATLGVYAQRLGETRITSPMDGYVADRRVDPGVLVGQGGVGTILTLVKIDLLRVYISVNESQAGGVRLGMNAHVELDALPGNSYSGRVVRLAPAFDPTTRTLQAEVDIANHDGELRAGMYGMGSIVLATHPNVPVVPAIAVQITEGKRYVFTVDGDIVHRREIETGVDGGTWFEVTRGLAPGEEVVIAGADAVSDGAKVRVARDVDPFTGQPTNASAAPSGKPSSEVRPAGRPAQD